MTIDLRQNIGSDHSEWAYRDKAGKWTTGRLLWPKRKHRFRMTNLADGLGVDYFVVLREKRG